MPSLIRLQILVENAGERLTVQPGEKAASSDTTHYNITVSQP